MDSSKEVGLFVLRTWLEQGCKVWAGSDPARPLGKGFLEFLSGAWEAPAWEVPRRPGRLLRPPGPKICRQTGRPPGGPERPFKKNDLTDAGYSPAACRAYRAAHSCHLAPELPRLPASARSPCSTARAHSVSGLGFRVWGLRFRV